MLDPRLLEYARRMRTAPSPTERLDWRLLRRRRRGGFHFRRQHPIPPYIADFYCAVAKVVVEVDGDSHVGQEDNDRRRQEFLESLGLKVLRFWNSRVFDEQDSFTETVYQECLVRVEADPRLAGRLDDAGQFRRRDSGPTAPA